MHRTQSALIESVPLRSYTTALPELTRLIDAGVLRELTLNVYDSFDEAESTRLFVAAVRASAMTKLEILEYVSPKIVVDAAAFINARQQ